MRDHGGNLDAAIARHGAGDWIDLSTGINRRPYPLPPLSASAWQALPTAAQTDGLIRAARHAWSVAEPTGAIALAGAQTAIQLVPLLRPPGRAAVLTPTYNEHAATLRGAGWQVQESPDLAGLAGADLAVVVNPNNPDGQSWAPATLRALAETVGLLVVDESFADATPDLSVLRGPLPPNLLVLRSFGKFYGLAGLRLGFAFGAPDLVARLRGHAGPWPVSGPAIEIGAAALADAQWADQMRAQLSADARRADGLIAALGWTVVGGTTLFRLYHTPDAAAAQADLARHKIWSRIFPYSGHWLRLGLPGPEPEWDRLSQACRR